MDCLKRFSILGRALTLRSKTLQDIRLTEKYKQTYYSLASVNSNLKKPEKKSNRPVFQTERCYCDVINRNINKIATFEPYYSLFPLFTITAVMLKIIPFRLMFDKTFSLKTFTESSEVVLKVISKLIADKRLSELEGLVTPQCINELRDKIDNWNPNERGDITVTEADYLATIMYSLNPSFSEEHQKIIFEASVCHLILKNLASDFDETKHSVQELVQKMNKKLEDPEQDVYAANYRYVKVKGTDQWIVNGINHFRVKDMLS